MYRERAARLLSSSRARASSSTSATYSAGAGRSMLLTEFWQQGHCHCQNWAVSA